MPYTVDVERAATASLGKFPRGDQQKIKDKIAELQVNPRPPGVVKLTGSEGWRIRIGNYRVVYTIDDSEQLVTVTRIAHRKSVYRRL